MESGMWNRYSGRNTEQYRIHHGGLLRPLDCRSNVCPKAGSWESAGILCYCFHAMTSIPELRRPSLITEPWSAISRTRMVRQPKGADAPCVDARTGPGPADPRSGTAQVLAPSPVSAKSQWEGAVPIGSSVAPAGVLEGDAACRAVFDFEKLGLGRRNKKRKKLKACAQLQPAGVPPSLTVT